MKKILVLTFLFISFYIKGQSILDWQVPVTDGNATIGIGVGNGATGASDPTLNGGVLPDGSLIGVFFLNDNNEYVCGGATVWNATENLAVAAWGAESGLDDGFQVGESYNWFVRVCDGDCWPIDLDDNDVIDFDEVLDGVDYISNDAVMVDLGIFDITYVYNGLSGLLSADFVEYIADDEETLSCECEYGMAVMNDTDADGVGDTCMILNACDDPLASNYCPGLGDGLTLYFSQQCQYDETLEGCTCEEAYNYDSNATVDDGSCVIISGGCSDSSADNYSGDECSSSIFAAENCVYEGCLCPESYNYDSNATVDDGSCVIISGGCSDSSADNYSGDECSSSIFAAEDCQYTPLDVDLNWDYTVTDANMTIQISPNTVTFNGEEPLCGSFFGAFFTNDQGQLQNAGYVTWCDDFTVSTLDGSNMLQLAIMASESGLDNGFAAGEEIIWGLSTGGQDFLATSSEMNSAIPFSTTFASLGFGQVLSAVFEGELSAILGCTDSSAYNYDSNATWDDGSCYNLDWEMTPTDCNMTILINSPEVLNLDISLNNGEIPVGSTIGVFYENGDGVLVCGGSTIWTGTATSLPAFGSESGLDNGFQVGEEFATWALLIGDQTITMDLNGATMNEIGWQSTYSCNGLANILSVNFEGEYTLIYGCTDTEACNYDDTAMIDDDTCDYGQTWYQDSDSDGLGNPDVSVLSCDGQVSGFVTNDDDPCPDTENNPNNAVIWYLDSDGDGLGDDIQIAVGCDYPGSPEFPLADNNNDPCPFDPDDTDEDNDGICDLEDDCVGEYDALGICNGACLADDDNDGVCDTDEIYGCTDSSAFNFDSLATENDNSCCYISGCTDSSAFNYNSNACSDDGSCIAIAEGCTDSSAFNYDSTANIDDGSCVPFIFGCMDSTACDYDSTANIENGCTYAEEYYDCDDNCLIDTDGDGTCDELEVLGCTDSTAYNYATSATEDDGSCVSVVYGCIDPTALNYDSSANTDDENCCYIAGCTESNAFNYNSNACSDDGSCVEVLAGCTDPSALNYDSSANTDDENCCYIGGCTDSSAFNYDNTACFDNGSCVEVLAGCTDSSAFNYDSTANTDDGSCVDYIFGCTDDSACNYNESANTDNGCAYPDDYYDCTGFCLNDIDGDGICDELEVGGCTNPVALNYNPQATDSNFCIFPGCLDSSACNFDSEGTYPEFIDCDYESCLGCIDSSAENYDPEATIDNGSCIIIGCIDSLACNYNGLATDDSGFCEYPEEYLDCDGNCLEDEDLDGVCSNVDCDDNDNNLGEVAPGFDCNGNALLLDSPWGNNNGCDPFNTHIVGFTVEGLNLGDFIGLFYANSDGDLEFAQGIEYTGNNFSFTVCGDDQTTSEKDGFDIGESFIWQLWPVGEDCAYSINVDYSESQPSAGEYQFNGISQVTSFSGSSLDVSVIVTDALCNGGLGSAELTVTGGVAPYQIEDLSSLPVGLNNTTVLDAVGCQFELEFIVQEPDLLTSSVDIINPLCNGGLGSAELTVTGGTAPYDMDDLSSLSAGSYTTIVTDANGCSVALDFEVIGPELLEVSINTEDVSCNGDSDGSATIEVSGGSGEYDYEVQVELESLQNNYSLLFDGVDDYINCGNNSSYNLGYDDFTIQAWVFNQDTNANCRVFARGNTNTPGGYQMNVAPNGRLRISIDNMDWFSDVGVIQENVWHHLVLTRNDGVIEAFVDGEIMISFDISVNLDCSDDLDGNGVADCFDDQNGNGVADGVMHIGNDPGFEWDSSFPGYIDNVSLWNIGFSQDEIQDFFNCPSIVTVNNLIGYWNFEEGSGEVAYDMSIYSNDADINGPVYSNIVQSINCFSLQSISSDNLDNLSAGDYVITTTDSNGCFDVIEFSISEPEELSLNLESTPGEYSNCISGTASVFVEGGTPAYEYLWSNGETTSEITGLCGGDYSVTVTDANGCIIEETTVIVDYVTPEGWETTSNLLGTHYIYMNSDLDSDFVNNMLLDQTPLVPGDYVGVFFNNDDGTQSCGGYVMLDENGYLNEYGDYGVLMAYGNDGSDNIGFSQGEQFNWRVWSSETETESHGFAVYSDICPNERYFEWNGGESCLSGAVFATHQVISLNENPYSDWDMISTYISSEETVQSIFAPVSEELVIIKDATDLVYWPAVNIETLTTFNTNDAYAVKTWAPNEITVFGDFIQPEEISFSLSGWNYMSYPRYYPEDVDVVLSDLASNIKLLKDDEGNLYWPELGINTIGQMEAGEGYILKVLDDQVFTYPSNSDSEIGGSTVAEGRVGLMQTTYFTDIEKTNSNMVVGLPIESWINFSPEDGDELVVYDADQNIVGVSVLKDDNNVVIIWGDDNESLSKDGMLIGEEFFIELWDQSINTIYSAEIDWLEGVSFFSNNGINIASSIYLEKKFENSLEYISCFPNPTSGHISIEFYLYNDDYINVSIFNSIGEKVYGLDNNLFTEGVNKLPISLSHLSQGLYYIEVQNSQENKNIIIDLTK